MILKMKASIICCALMGVVLLSSIDLSASECCYVQLKCKETSKTVSRCYDCTEATPFCGKGKCNVLGCNCDDGCRQGDSSLWCWNLASGCKGSFSAIFAAPIKADANGLLATLDTDSDGQLSLKETAKFVLSSGQQNVDIEEEFNKMDANGDGFLSVNEIDN